MSRTTVRQARDRPRRRRCRSGAGPGSGRSGVLRESRRTDRTIPPARGRRRCACWIERPQQLLRQLGGAQRAGRPAAAPIARPRRDRVEHVVRVDREIAHDARVERPLDLRERDEQVLAGQQILAAAARLVFGAGQHALGAVGQLREVEFEIFHRRWLLCDGRVRFPGPCARAIPGPT